MVMLSQCGRHRTALVFDVHNQPRQLPNMLLLVYCQ